MILTLFLRSFHGIYGFDLIKKRSCQLNLHMFPCFNVKWNSILGLWEGRTHFCLFHCGIPISKDLEDFMRLP